LGKYLRLGGVAEGGITRRKEVAREGCLEKRSMALKRKNLRWQEIKRLKGKREEEESWLMGKVGLPIG